MKFLIPLLLPLAAPLCAGELSPAQVPSTAKWLLHADLDAMRSSETGKAVFSRIEAEHGAKLRALKRMFSLHLINDLRDITLFGDGLKDHAVVLFDGTFDQAHIEDVLKAADGYSGTSHEGIAVHSWTDKGKPQNAAFAKPDLLVFSPQRDLLYKQLDALKANAPGTENPLLSAPGSRPLIAAAARLAEMEMPEDSARVLRQIGLMKLSAHEEGGRFSIKMNAATPNPKRANSLRRILDGIVALSEIGNPDLASSDFQSAIDTTDQPGVNAAVSLPVAQWLSLMEKGAKAKARAAGKE